MLTATVRRNFKGAWKILFIQTNGNRPARGVGSARAFAGAGAGVGVLDGFNQTFCQQR